MIFGIDLDTAPMMPGEARRLIVNSSAESLTITIKCFVSDPPPPGFRSCPECGTINARSGEPVQIVASSRFLNAQSSVAIEIQDSEGDVRNLSVEVLSRAEESSQSS